MRRRTSRPLIPSSILCFLTILLPGLLSGCASQHSPYNRYYATNGAYKAPGPANDPWGPYIQAAARRFSLPEAWIRAVIHQESGGHQYLHGQPITSSAGAMGLMQLMPQTYAEMQDRFGLGSDPYEPHDNIMAGSGYIRILSGKYGAPAFLAAYNAGPRRLEDYLYNGRPLPNETVNYVANITPNLGTQVALSGPLAAYASTTQLNASPPETTEPVQIAESTPDQTVQQAWANRRITSVPSDPIPPPLAPLTPCDPDTAYDPDTLCTPAPQNTLSPPTPTVQTADNRPLPPPPAIPTPARSTLPPPTYGNWSIQVGAFTNPGQARFATTMARQAAFSALQAARVDIQPTTAHGTRFWRARLAGLSRTGAASACRTIGTSGMACIAVPPG